MTSKDTWEYKNKWQRTCPFCVREPLAHLWFDLQCFFTDAFEWLGYCIQRWCRCENNEEEWEEQPRNTAIVPSITVNPGHDHPRLCELSPSRSEDFSPAVASDARRPRGVLRDSLNHNQPETHLRVHFNANRFLPAKPRRHRQRSRRSRARAALYEAFLDEDENPIDEARNVTPNIHIISQDYREINTVTVQANVHASEQYDPTGDLVAPITPPPNVYDNVTPQMNFATQSRRLRSVTLEDIANATVICSQPRPLLSINMQENDEYRDRKIVLEFTHLLEKSKQLFTGLRALPQHGHKHWQFYFSRTFDVYTKLWKYQQQHRTLLNEEYGLRRWQIGEIASKIGQLYYHFYLRTSEVTYLLDAYEFYAAIRGRGYYTKAADESNGDLMIKRLRYYTRFIVVSLLTRKLKFVEELISELDDVIMEYGDSYDPEDQIQWTMVSSEVKAFLGVECAIIIEDPECKKSLRTKTRLTPVSIPCIDKTPQMNLRLQKAVIIGSGSYQAKVSELTIDMYRILQTIEREPVQSRQVWEEPRNPFADGFDRAFNIEIATANAPEKNLLFKPSPTQALVYIASACEDLSPIGALLIYISADGVSPNTKGGEDYGFETGGLITTSKSDIYGDLRASTPARYKEIQCLHPGDLQPFTRKPMFLIVDSDHSTIFLKMRRPFEMPMVILMSPTEFPPALKDYENVGGLLTLFLYSPLGAVCRICAVDNINADMWVEAQILINNFLQEAVVVAVRLPLDPSYISFLGDDFLRVQISRYIFCEKVLRMHRGFVSRNHLPRSSPSIPDQLFENLVLTEMVLELASFLKIRSQFFNPLASGGGPSN